MAILDTFKRVFGIPVNKNKLNEALYQHFIFDGMITTPDDRADEYLKQGYAGNADVFSIISRIDSMRKRAKLKLYRKLDTGELDEVTEHELLPFLTKVNKDMSTDDYITAFLIYRLVIGESFTYRPKIDKGINKGKTGEIRMMPSNEVDIVSGGWMEPVRGYKLEFSQQEFTKDEVYHDRFFNPLFATDRTFHGQSPLKAAARILAKQNQAEITQQKQFENQGPPYIMFRDASGEQVFNRLTDPQREELERDVKKASQEKRRGLPLILREKYGIITLGKQIADLNVIESSKDGRIVLCNIYGFPAVLMGLDQATYNNMKEARKAAWTDCIIPNLAAVEDAFNEMLIYGVDAYSDLQFAFDYSEIDELQEGIETRVAWMSKAGWTKNEIRQATGKYPIQDDVMDEPIFNPGEVPLGQMGGDLYGDYPKGT